MRKKKSNPEPDLTYEQKRVINSVLAYASQDSYLEDCEKQRREQIAMADAEFEKAALDWEKREAERRRVWGKKFPRVLGQLPDDGKGETKANNPVKPGVQKRSRTNRKGGRGLPTGL